ncbi:hypothetical protein GCM10011371_06960 [Novosphingobium marinum]|uniref:Glycosyltransferase RgtA/B/C/D-like domain-containing protein n=1 Tax=Novosphingobium marinum TaxID=1514948 RepID=A0A7Z0BTR6_9SPHN|nr:hypothetical protein [Novosphingobium marinum]NYH94383.1 hypothetical protein [Novosphingobium marinum]GGC21933.1 hypothetical protein GCM10011371_06960 [Novosphingobium marinum]
MTAAAQDIAVDRQSGFDLGAAVSRAFASRAAQFALFLLASLATRVAMFGDTNYHSDELLYFTIGQRMHEGLLPYVDMWDRKGPGLFLTYAGIAAFSSAVVAYQFAAALFAATTAFVVNMIAERSAGRVGAILAGLLYLAMLPLFGGGGGQAPVFYNLFVALSALGVMSGIGDLREGRIPPRVWLSMASAGFAITFKLTAAVEGVFLGCFVLWQLSRAVSPAALFRSGFRLAAAGAAPMVLFALFYAGIGHFAEFWHALVTSNLDKAYDADNDAAARLRALAIIASPALLPAIARLALLRNAPYRPFLAGWLAAAFVGFALVPNYIDHYALPLMLPLAVMAAPALEWRRAGPVFAIFVIVFAWMVGPTHDFAKHRESRAAMARIVDEIRARDAAPRLFVYQGPNYLNTLAGSHPPSPLTFPAHLFHRPENDVSHLDTGEETDRILDWRPSVVIKAAEFPEGALNLETSRKVNAYVEGCRLWFTREVIDYYSRYDVQIYGDCAKGRD